MPLHMFQHPVFELSSDLWYGVIMYGSVNLRACDQMRGWGGWGEGVG